MQGILSFLCLEEAIDGDQHHPTLSCRLTACVEQLPINQRELIANLERDRAKPGCIPMPGALTQAPASGCAVGRKCTYICRHEFFTVIQVVHSCHTLRAEVVVIGVEGEQQHICWGET